MPDEKRIHDAIEAGDSAELTLQLRDHEQLENESLWELLKHAIESGHVPILQLLLQHKAISDVSAHFNPPKTV